MTDENQGQDTDQPGGKPKRRWMKRLLAGALLVGVGIIPGFAIGAHSTAAWLWHGPKLNHLDGERGAKRIERGVERVLSRVDASPEQERQISNIAKAAVSDMKAVGVDPWETRRQFVELFRAETIDNAAIETLRAEQVNKIDTASKRLVQAMTDAAAVLTPEQRRQLADRMKKRRGWRHEG